MNNNSENLTGITLKNVGKKFRDRWVFKGLDFHVNAGEKVAINGHNGSGKSTLLQIIGGYVSASDGKVIWETHQGTINDDVIYRHIALASPYMDLIDEFTLNENIEFFIRLKPIRKGITISDIVKATGLKDAAHRQFRYFSSGMKQKVKLTLAFMAASELLLLDEPLSNLDQSGYEWYREMASNYSEGKTVLVCSNMVKEETFFCNRIINIEDYRS